MTPTFSKATSDQTAQKKQAMPAVYRVFELAIYGVTLLLPFVFFAWTTPLLSDTTIGNDYVAFPITQQISLQHSLERNTWPLFVPGFAGGRPSAALTLGQLFHPQSHIASVLPGYWDGHANDWNTVLRLLTLGCCQLVFLILFRRLRLTWTASFIVSLLTVYNMRMLDNFRYGASLENHTGHLFLVAAAAFAYLKPTRIIGPLFIIASCYLTVCGGHPQMMYFGLISAGVMALFLPFVMHAVSDEIPIDRLRLKKYYTGLLISGAVGLMLSAAYILPLYFDFVKDTAERATRAYGWSLAYRDTIGGVLNNLFNPLLSNVHGAFGNSSLLLVAFLTPLAVLFKTKIPKSILGIWLFALFAYLLTFGNKTPLHELWWRYFPLASTFRVPGRAAMMLVIPLAFLLAWLWRRPTRTSTMGKLSIIWSPFTAVSVLSVLTYILYNVVLHSHFKAPTNLTPGHIRDVPEWLPTVVVIVGGVSLVLAALPLSRARNWYTHVIAGLILIGVLFQTGALMWYGTWIVKHRSTYSLNTMDRRQQSRLAFHSHPGNAMRSDTVAKQMETSFLSQHMGKFYRNHITIPPGPDFFRKAAYLRTEDNIVVARQNSPVSSQPAKAVSATKQDRIEATEATFNRVLFEVENHAPGYFNFTFPDSTYWQAWVDNTETTVYPANGGESAVYLEPGTHLIEFRFFSRAAALGVALSLVALMLILFHVFSNSLPNTPRYFTFMPAVIIPGLLGHLWYGSLYDGDNLETRYTWTSQDLPSTKANLAFGKPTKMSSIKRPQFPFNHYAGRGVDGETRGSFCTHQRRNKPWWQVDLGKKTRVRELVIHDTSKTATQRVLPLDVLVSNSGKNFHIVKTLKHRDESRPWRIPLKAKGRYFRLKSHRPGALCFKEVEIYAQPAAEDRDGEQQ